jgi:predicted HicB family RNase H-like nuclease
MMRYKGYTAVVEFDPEAKILHGEVVGTRDVITFQADNAAEVEKAFRDSVDDYLAFCAERGESPEKPASGEFIVRLEPQLHRELQALSKMGHKSLNALVGQLLEEAVARTPQARPAAHASVEGSKAHRARASRRRAG